MSKNFDWVLHEGPILKKIYDCKWYLLTLIKSFLFKRQKGVVLNGPESKWLTIEAGVLHGSIIVSIFFFFYLFSIYWLIFLIFIKDLWHNIEYLVKAFSDVTSIFSVVPDLVTRQHFKKKKKNDLERVSLLVNKR